jgi:hypothetical protein
MGDKTDPSDVCAVVSVSWNVLTPAQGPARGMTVDEGSARHAERDGQAFSLCADHFRQEFLSTPAQSIAERGRSGFMKSP